MANLALILRLISSLCTKCFYSTIMVPKDFMYNQPIENLSIACRGR